MSWRIVAPLFGGGVLYAQASALAGLHTATALPWTGYLADKASSEAAWWSGDGSGAYLQWVTDTNAEYTAHTAAQCAAYTSLVDTVTTAETDYIAGEGQEDYDANVGRAQSASQSAQNKAAAAAALQTSNSSATLALAAGGDQTSYNAATAAAKLVYQQSAAGGTGS